MEKPEIHIMIYNRTTLEEKQVDSIDEIPENLPESFSFMGKYLRTSGYRIDFKSRRTILHSFLWNWRIL
jgi:hypothetical protein